MNSNKEIVPMTNIERRAREFSGFLDSGKRADFREYVKENLEAQII